MADLYEPKACAASSSSSDAPCGFPQDRDDVSVFLQNLFQSSSTSSVSPSTPASFMSFMARHVPSFSSFPPPSAALMESGSAGGAVAPFGRGGAGSPVRRNLTDSAECFPVAGKERMRYSLSFGGCSGPPMITSSAKQTKSLTDTDLNGAGCDIEGPPDEIDVHLKPAPLRSSSKRSRAAEVHNLSEKRRRSRINEKMKALQMLIPNSNKTDKASMLDEAIEYLKQLQLQVQMLSMRNGLNLQSVYVPGGVQPMPLAQPGVPFEEGNGLSGGSQTAPVHSSAFHIPEHSFGLQQTVATHYGCYAPSMSSKDVCRGDTLPLLQLDMGIAGKQSSEDPAS